MNGFLLSIGVLPKLTNKNKRTFYCQNEDASYYLSALKTKINKFDKTYFEDDKYIIAIEGIVLNKTELITQNNNWIATIIALYTEKGEVFFKDFRGSFSGVLFDKKTDKWIIYTDHIGSKHVYYNKIGINKYLFSSKIIEIVNFKKENNQKVVLDTNAAYMLLSYGYIISKYTLTKDIFKLEAGHYIVIENNKLTVKRYHIFSNKPDYKSSDSQLLNRLNNYFNQAVKRQFSKDVELDLDHLVGLSGGLDSRMTSLLAHKLGYIKQLNFSFSQSDYLDETIPKKIAADFKHEWIFKSLDNGLFLKNIDETTLLSEGNVNYFGLAHGNSLYKNLNFKNFGIIHTGQLGEVISGTYNTYKIYNKDFSVESGAFSKKLISKINFTDINLDFENEEIFKFYLRGFSGMNAGLLALQHYSETMAPFYDVDLMEYALSIPVEKRYNHKIYMQWISKYQTEATNYIWEKTGNKPVKSFYDIDVRYKGKKITIKKVFRQLKFFKPQVNTKNHMNPFDYWYNTNPEIKDFFNSYFAVNVELLKEYSELKTDAIHLFKTGTILEKGLVLSLLSYLKVIHNQNEL